MPLLPDPISVLFLCLGNHCRSPAAEAVARAHVQRDAKLAARVSVASAGTNRDHIGQAAHRFTIAEGTARGYDLGKHRGRRITDADFAAHALIVCMDRSNVATVEHLRAGRELRPGPAFAAFPSQVRLLLGSVDLEDPWSEPQSAYATMYDAIEQSMPDLLRELVLHCS
jgi:protein-tyrosine phosphatase